MPGCTSEASTIVLLGAASQWNRTAGARRAIGPADGSPAAIRAIPTRRARTSPASQSGASAHSRASSSIVRAPRDRCGRLRSAIPALNRSPRSEEARPELRDERLRALPRTPELDHAQAVVVPP